jgi:molybdopterin-binding protein
MNSLPGIIKKIQQSGAIQLIDLAVDDQAFSAMLLDSATNQEWMKVDATVSIIFKETEVSIAKDFMGKISMRNQLQCTIQNIDKGKLLSIIHLQFGKHQIASAITTRSVETLGLQINDKVTALIKSNEISIINYELQITNYDA